MIKLLICIDDTDNLESIGTGEIADQIRAEIKAHQWGETSDVTRHQLFIHEDIAYTSHNSSMCFEANIKENYKGEVKQFIIDFLETKHAPGSDPGLCIVELDHFKEIESLISFGKKAKTEVLTKDQAYDFAKKTNIHLSEHGGTGLGVIGALAGCGLRLSGNDGRFKGKLKFSANSITVEELCASSNIDEVHSLEGEILLPTEEIQLNRDVKAVLLNNKKVMLVQKQEENTSWELVPKEILKKY